MRRFTDEPVADEDIEACLRAVVQAPSGGNIQPYQFLVVTDPAGGRRVARWYRGGVRPLRGVAAGPDVVPLDPRTRRRGGGRATPAATSPTTWPRRPRWCCSCSRSSRGRRATRRARWTSAGSMRASTRQCRTSVSPPRSLGLGTTLTTVIRIHTAEVLAELGVPEGRFQIAALVPVGVPVGSFGVARRKPAGAVTHWNQWGDRRR